MSLDPEKFPDTTENLPKDSHSVCETLHQPKTKTMKSRPTRICIYPKDIQRITGRSERYSRNLIHKIKASLHKEEHQALTVHEFCTYMGIPIEAAKELIKD